MNNPAKILLIEDNPGDARLVKEILAEGGTALFQLTWVTDLTQGLAHLEKNSVDAILLDLSLPDSTGFATFEKLYTLVSQLPIVLLTGLDDEDQASKAVREGAQDYLVKGQVDGNLLTRSIRYAIERKRTEQAMVRQTEELNRLYRASGSLISGNLLDLKSLAQTVIDVVLQEFGHSNCSVFLVQKNSNELRRLAAGGTYADEVSKTILTIDGAGLIPEAIRTGRMINIPDVRDNPAYIPAWSATCAELTIPLKIGDQMIGAIDIQSTKQDAFSADDERLMSIFGERAAFVFEHARLFAETEQRLSNLVSLRAIDLAISSSFDLRITLGILLEEATKQLGVHAADILVFNLVTLTFDYSSGKGFHTSEIQNTNIRLSDNYVGRSARERRSIVIHDLEKNLAGYGRFAFLLQEGFSSYICIPLIAKGQIKGAMEVFHRERLELGREGQEFLEMLGGQAGIAIDNVELFEKLQSSNVELLMAYDETIEGWSRAMDIRDEETEDHTQRVTQTTLKMASNLGFSDIEMVNIRRGALLHDIGKIGVPDKILHKPGPLTEKEWGIMRKHPQLAYDMLAPIMYLRSAIEIPYCHHEKWDGTGYPRGLKEDQIPLSARIFAVVDVWDALISDRPYRKAWSREQTLDHIREQSGKYFDPKVVDIFLKMISSVS